MSNEVLYEKIISLPDALKKKVEEFVSSLTDAKGESFQKKKPVFGSAKGMFVMKPDFDEPLDDFNEYMH